MMSNSQKNFTTATKSSGLKGLSNHKLSTIYHEKKEQRK